MVPLREKFLFCIIEKYNIYIIWGESHVIYLQARVFFFFFLCFYDPTNMLYCLMKEEDNTTWFMIVVD